MKFTKEKVSSLLGHTEIRRACDEFLIISSPFGVVMRGDLEVVDENDLRVLAEAIGGAWTDVQLLKPKLDLN